MPIFFTRQSDKVKFGEVVYEPPSLTALPRKAIKEDTVPRVGNLPPILYLNVVWNIFHKNSKCFSSMEKEKGGGGVENLLYF